MRFVVMVLVLLSGCASVGGAGSLLDPWQGRVLLIDGPAESNLLVPQEWKIRYGTIAAEPDLLDAWDTWRAKCAAVPHPACGGLKGGAP